jgi:voltage-gated potassium channel
VFLFFILTLVTIIGSVLYVVEGAVNSGFSSIPRSIYWAIVTLTTVGYGDIAPITDLGRFLAAIVMLMGYSIIAVPTGIMTAEIINHAKNTRTIACRNCSHEGHDGNAKHCKYCGFPLF